MAGSPVHTGSLGTSAARLEWGQWAEASGTWSRAARTPPAASGCEEASRCAAHVKHSLWISFYAFLLQHAHFSHLQTLFREGGL